MADVTVEAIVGDDARRDALGLLLEDAPDLVFTASHGLGMPLAHADQSPLQGALVCQEWPGPSAGHFDPAWCFAAADVDPAVDLAGMISFHFACYGAGTPRYDDFADARRRHVATAVGSRPAPSSPPCRSGCSANPAAAPGAVGHVERAWGYSFDSPDVGSQTGVYESTIRRLLDGHPLGSALEHFNQRYAELASDLLAELEEVAGGGSRTRSDWRPRGRRERRPCLHDRRRPRGEAGVNVNAFPGRREAR